MSHFEQGRLCVFGHFNQPPRGNPLTREIGTESAAAPYENWNTRIADHCYRPNAVAGNFSAMSFSMGEPLMRWLEMHEPEIYEAIIASDRPNEDGHGSALATTYHHSILPLARKRDKRTQIRWGIAAFEQRFGRKPLGFWLPEMAVDHETLSLLAEMGIQYTILAHQQLQGLPREAGAGPFKIALPHNHAMGVYVRDDSLSSEISFNIHNLGGAGHWARNALAPARKNVGDLVLLATEGETFGHHYAGEDQFLQWLLKHEAPAVGYNVTLLDQDFAAHPPRQSVTIHEPSSWSDQRGLANWATGHANTAWKGALRRTLDNVANELDRAYEDVTRSAKVDAWQLRDQYASVLLGVVTDEEFIAELLPDIEPAASEQLQVLMKTQELAQRMYTSYTFTNNVLNSAQPRYAIACAAAALALAQQATGHFMSERLLPDLAVVTAEKGAITGTDLLNQVLTEYALDLELAD